ncbi:methionine--tRNA ligase [bacterium]|nr:MAG: methionine--tRNA ligase [bacterium]
MFKRTLVTAALPYANGPLHLGHLAGAYLPSDLYVRYKRLAGEDIVFICGSDEHGVAITIAAEKAGVKPQDIIDKYHTINKKAFEDFGIAFDYYGRTSSPVHHETSQEFFTNLHDKGIFKQKEEEQLFDEKAGMFLPDRYVKGTCPVCGFEEAYGDQCEKCGSSLSPSELKNPKSTLTGETPILKKTTHWYLPLGEQQAFIESWINTKTDWKSNVLGQVKSWLTQGLADRAITRDLNWGVKVPLPHSEGKVLYVWLDAPIGYISATKEWAIEQGNPDLWKTYWQDNDTRLLHFIGKDNIVFHCIMFPSILKTHGDYILPDNVPANEFLNLEGKKFSTSRGWAVWLHEYLEAFDADLLRYALGSTLPELKDGDFSWKDFQLKNNSELADIFGNFIFRTLSFVTRYFDGKVPVPALLNDDDKNVLAEIESTGKRIAEKYERFQFKDAIFETMSLARLGNKYFTDQEPWKTRKTDPERCATSLYVCSQLVAALSVYFEPIMPSKMNELKAQLQFNGVKWNEVKGELLQAGHQLSLGEILFAKIEDERIDAQLEKLHQTTTPVSEPSSEAINYTPVKEAIEFDDFAKLDLRVGKIVAAEAVPKSKKLLKLQIELGFETRQILSGVSEHFKPEDLIGKKVPIVANLKPRTMLGLESNGMVLFSESPDGKLVLIESDNLPGTTIS